MQFKLSEQDIVHIQTAVLEWFAANGRHDLPWRNLASLKIDEGYGVMVSEFMLQQTQVERVVPKYRAFLHIFPTVYALADATPAKVVTLWSGLGYNRRAILLHKAAGIIVNQYNAIVPNDVDTLASLPGIGPYAASAIASFAYNKRVVVLDTNIERFYELLFFGYSKPTAAGLRMVANQFLPHDQSRLWHSALMDLMSNIRTKKTPSEQQAELLRTLVLSPTWKLPKLTNVPLKRPKQSAFKLSARFYRGRIIAFLSERPQHRATYAQIAKMLQGLTMPLEYSAGSLLIDLKKDGLVHFNEPLKPRSIVRLPD